MRRTEKQVQQERHKDDESNCLQVPKDDVLTFTTADICLRCVHSNLGSYKMLKMLLLLVDLVMSHRHLKPTRICYWDKFAGMGSIAVLLTSLASCQLPLSKTDTSTILQHGSITRLHIY